MESSPSLPEWSRWPWTPKLLRFYNVSTGEPGGFGPNSRRTEKVQPKAEWLEVFEACSPSYTAPGEPDWNEVRSVLIGGFQRTSSELEELNVEDVVRILSHSSRDRESIESAADPQRASLSSPPSQIGERTLLEPASQHRFRRAGDFWEIVYKDEKANVRDLKGMQHLAQLLARPNPFQPMSAAELSGRQERQALGESTFQPVLDSRAKEQYRKELEDFDEEISEAERNNDFARTAKLKEEKAMIHAELQKAVGLSGKDRKLGSSSPERGAANAVRENLKRAYAAMTECGLTALVSHLRSSIQTESNAYAYRSGPNPPDWEL